MLVDSSVWIDFLHKRRTPQTSHLHAMIGGQGLITADLVLVEVLQGLRDDLQAKRIENVMTQFGVIQIVDTAVAVQAARNYRTLRALGVTPRKTIDTLIATRCIADGIALLYSDRDFDPFVEHLGLRSAL